MNVSSWNVSTFAAITVVLLDFYVGARYCTKLIRKEISPRIATWLIFEIGRKVFFTRYELLSLGVSCVAAIAWTVTKTGWIGFIGFQLVMSVAYLPTVESLWRWKSGPSPEPMEKWGINVMIALIGVVVDITGQQDYLAMVYPLRALILCIVVVALIIRWKQKNIASKQPF